MTLERTVPDSRVRTERLIRTPRIATISALAVLCWTIVAAIVYIACIALIVLA